MPELPEIETTLRSLEPHLINTMISQTIIRQPRLRWIISNDFADRLKQQRIINLSRRGKYLLIHLNYGTVIIHLGMSGSLRILNDTVPAKNHDHVDIILTNNKIIRYNDPRRFGAMLWTENPFNHHLLKSLGTEPLEKQFTSHYLTQKAKNRRVPIKIFIMDNKIVVGVGNIYASESLFLANIHPAAPAFSLTESQLQKLTQSIKRVLKSAIKQGGTTIKDFVNSEGKPGYFSQRLKVYGRAEQPCLKCNTILKMIKLGQRSSVFCPCCQPVCR